MRPDSSTSEAIMTKRAASEKTPRDAHDSQGDDLSCRHDFINKIEKLAEQGFPFRTDTAFIEALIEKALFDANLEPYELGQFIRLLVKRDVYKDELKEAINERYKSIHKSVNRSPGIFFRKWWKFLGSLVAWVPFRNMNLQNPDDDTNPTVCNSSVGSPDFGAQSPAKSCWVVKVVLMCVISAISYAIAFYVHSARPTLKAESLVDDRAMVRLPIALSQSNLRNSHFMEIRADHSLWARTTENSDHIPLGENYKWKSVSVGEHYSLAITEDGGLWVWGENLKEHNGSRTYDFEQLLVDNKSRWKVAVAGLFQTLMLKMDGTLWTLGEDTLNQSSPESNLPRSIRLTLIPMGNQKDWKTLSVGRVHAVALKNDGSLWAWGKNDFGQLGDGTTKDSDDPVRIGLGTDWAAVSACYDHTIAIKSDGSLWVWGKNVTEHESDGTKGFCASPIRIDAYQDWAVARPSPRDGFSRTLSTVSHSD